MDVHSVIVFISHSSTVKGAEGVISGDVTECNTACPGQCELKLSWRFRSATRVHNTSALSLCLNRFTQSCSVRCRPKFAEIIFFANPKLIEILTNQDLSLL